MFAEIEKEYYTWGTGRPMAKKGWRMQEYGGRERDDSEEDCGNQ